MLSEQQEDHAKKERVEAALAEMNRLIFQRMKQEPKEEHTTARVPFVSVDAVFLWVSHIWVVAQDMLYFLRRMAHLREQMLQPQEQEAQPEPSSSSSSCLTAKEREDQILEEIRVLEMEARAMWRL